MEQKCKDYLNKTNPGRRVHKKWHTVIPLTFKEGKHLTWYAENETFELHKRTGISSLLSSVLSWPCLDDVQSECAGWRQGCAPFPDSWVLPGSSFSRPAGPAALHSCWPSNTGNVDLTQTWCPTHAVEGRSLPHFSMCLCSFHISIFLAKPTSFHRCGAVRAWLSTQTLTSMWI